MIAYEKNKSVLNMVSLCYMFSPLLAVLQWHKQSSPTRILHAGMKK